MAKEKTAETQDVSDTTPDTNRERSQIGFPYGDLDDASGVTKGVHQVGGNTCELNQLAAHLQMAASGGGFRQRLLTAKMFGLVSYGRETISLTALGGRLCDSKQEKTAKAYAFLTVPLYKQIYEKFKSGVLPPTNEALETAMVQVGVAKKVKDKARQTFQRSAQQAGFFWAGNDRLVMPKGSTATIDEPTDIEHKDSDETEKNKDKDTSGGGNNAGGGGRHPFIQGLLKEMPSEGSVWPTADRVKWLKAAAMIIDLIYTNEDTGKPLKIEVSADSAK